MKGPKFARLMLELYLKYFSNASPIDIIIDTVKGNDPFLRKIAAVVGNNPHLQLRLNISPDAVRDFVIDDDGVRFTAAFGGVPHDIHIQIENVLWIIDPKTRFAHLISYQVIEGPGGPSIAWPEESVPEPESDPDIWGTPVPEQRERPTGPPTLKVVK